MKKLMLLPTILLSLASCNNSTLTPIPSSSPARHATTEVEYHYHAYMFGPMYDRKVSVDAKGVMICTDTMTTPNSPPITDTASRQLTVDEHAKLLKALSALPNRDVTIPAVPDSPLTQIDYVGHQYVCGDPTKDPVLNEAVSLIERLSTGITSGKATPAGVR